MAPVIVLEQRPYRNPTIFKSYAVKEYDTETQTILGKVLDLNRQLDNQDNVHGIADPLGKAMLENVSITNKGYVALVNQLDQLEIYYKI